MADQMVTISSEGKDFPAYVAVPRQGVLGGVIVIHEVWSLDEHTKDVARRLATEGYVTLAPNLLSGTELDGGLDPQLLQRAQNPETRDEAQKELRAKMAPLQSPEFATTTVNKLKSCFEWLIGKPEVQGHVAVIGFCFGGTYAFALAVHEPRLKAAVPFYGHADQSIEELRKINCPILAFYGEEDTGLTEKLPELIANMKAASRDFQYHVYPNTGHAFFNDTNPNRYNEAAAKDSWQKTLAFLSKNLQNSSQS